MTEEILLENLLKIKKGTKISSIDGTTFYTFLGIESYKGRGIHKHLTGNEVIILRSAIRTKPLFFRLFLEPVVHIINSKYKNVGRGQHPILNINEFRGNRKKYPNLLEFNNQYNAFCLFLKKKRFK